jgi:metallo-beta-lactamase family protein
MAEVTFVGASGTVTGSATLLKWGSRSILVDCGLFQGGYEIDKLNREPFPFEPREVDAVLVTHAHLDHVGLLPRLVKEGFSGPIYCTKPTRPMARLVLEDSAELQEEQARYARKKGYSRHGDPQPLYLPADAKRALELFQAVRFDDDREIFPGIEVNFRRSGHLLGAANVEITAKDGDGQKRTWLFSGDVGRYDVPILHDPQPSQKKPDTLVLESTYGDRLHGQGDPQKELRAALEACFARGGVAVIPAFALGRTQDILYYLAALKREGFLQEDQVILDSPMAIEATELYARFAAEHDPDLEKLRLQDQDPLGVGEFLRARSSEESRAINRRHGPLVIVASSGMAEGGRVVHHLKQRLPDARNLVLFVGYQAASTRGRALVDGAHQVAIHGVPVPVNAEVKILTSLSAHGDANELQKWATSLPGVPSRVYLNHGEDPARKALAAALEAKGLPRPVLPLRGDTFPF